MTLRLTEEEFVAIRKRADASTRGNWNYTVGGGEGSTSTVASFGKELTLIGDIKTLYDAEFIAHAHEDIPVLLAEIERLQAELTERR